ncbi:DUF5413 family protein, partial [Bradyrhizobium sp. NAS96.2]|uniref:DUF5413 family protein n=1 Tax=Bradyrhizobium sp. NAS96.2 TaxID=1680160 RepID=UPI000969D0BA
IEGFSHFVTSMTAPIASGWSVCRVGFAPTGKRRLLTAHTRSGHLNSIATVFGPSLGLLVSLIFGRGNAKDVTSDTFVILLLVVYLNGLVPALITAAFDGYLDRRVKGISKWLLAGSFGYVVAYVNILVPLLVYDPKWGLVGAIPAVICSALTDQVIGSAKDFARA